MSKIGQKIIEAQEKNGPEFYRAMDEWEMDKLNKIVFHKEMRDGKICLVNTKETR